MLGSKEVRTLYSGDELSKLGPAIKEANLEAGTLLRVGFVIEIEKGKLRVQEIWSNVLVLGSLGSELTTDVLRGIASKKNPLTEDLAHAVRAPLIVPHFLMSVKDE